MDTNDDKREREEETTLHQIRIPYFYERISKSCLNLTEGSY